MLIENGILKSIDENDIVDGKLVIPEGVIEIGKKALLRIKKLKTVEFPESLEKIGMGAFAMCTSLVSIKFPKNLKEIGFRAFDGCTNLEEIIFNNSLQVIGREAFSRCKSLQVVNLPEGVTDIGFGAFCECNNLREISFPESLKFLNTLHEKKEVDSAEEILALTLDCYESIESIRFPNFISSFESKERYNFISLFKNLKRISIPVNVECIGDYTFSSCKSLEEITLSRNTRGGSRFVYPTKVIYPEIEDALRERGVSQNLIDEVATEINSYDFQRGRITNQYKNRIIAWCERGIVPSWDVFSEIPINRINEFKDDRWNEFINNPIVESLEMYESDLIKLAFVFGIFDDGITVVRDNESGKNFSRDAKARMDSLIDWIQTRKIG